MRENLVPCIRDKSRRGRVITMGRLQDEGLQRSLLRVTAAVRQDDDVDDVTPSSAGLLPTATPPFTRPSTVCGSNEAISPIDKRRDDQVPASWLVGDVALHATGLRADKGLS